MTERWGMLPLGEPRPQAEHITSTKLDPQAGGWLSVCSCGWTVPRASYYKARSVARLKRHLEETLR